MDWRIPDWYTLVLLSLAAYRLWRLVAEDTIFDRPRGLLVRRLPKGEEWILCPWCSGLWTVVAVWLAWVWEPYWTLVVAVPLVLSALVGLVSANLDRD